jgi:hypothetical protein
MTELEQLEQFHAELCADIGGNCVTGDRYADRGLCARRDEVWARICELREQLAAEIAAEEEAGLA